MTLGRLVELIVFGPVGWIWRVFSTIDVALVAFKGLGGRDGCSLGGEGVETVCTVVVDSVDPTTDDMVAFVLFVAVIISSILSIEAFDAVLEKITSFSITGAWEGTKLRLRIHN